MLIDANLLLYAVDESSAQHTRSRDWLTSVLNGDERVGLPWLSLGAFMRITTNPRAVANPCTAAEAWAFIEEWLSLDTTWIPIPGERHREILGGLVRRYDTRANLVTDAQMAALAIEHGLKLYSADTDFARFREIDWINPIA
jgi:toxin-antitoxin system PIN domain toxin